MESDTFNNSTTYPKPIKNRLRRIEGQLRGVLNMMEREQGCRDVMTQLSAIRAGVERVQMYVIATNMERCIREEVTSGQPSAEAIEEAIRALMKIT